MDILSYFIVGAIVAFLVQIIKKYFPTNNFLNVGIVIALSLIAGMIYTFLSGTAYWPTVVQVIGSASTIYGFFIRAMQPLPPLPDPTQPATPPIPTP